MKPLKVLWLLLALVIGGFLGPARPDTTKTKRAPTFNRLLTSAQPEDYGVIVTALNHFSSLKEAHSFNPSKRADLIVLHHKTPDKSGMIWEEQIRNELKSENRNKSLPAELGVSLRARNSKSVSLKSLKRSKNVVIEDLDKYPVRYGFERWDALRKQHPRIKVYAETWLPGYSKDGQQALLRFSFGPTAHGATATYLLVKQNQQWKVKWHMLSFYV